MAAQKGICLHFYLTVGFRGQARVIIPTQSSCYECSLDMLAQRAVFPVCTIASTPRLPEHCIEWASVLEWPRLFPGMSFYVLTDLRYKT
jgi:NEDD8-activating enzyme E1